MAQRKKNVTSEPTPQQAKAAAARLRAYRARKPPQELRLQDGTPLENTDSAEAQDMQESEERHLEVYHSPTGMVEVSMPFSPKKELPHPPGMK